MVGYAYDPMAEDLSVNALRAKVKSSGVSADGDGFYYKAGQLVEITGDEQVGIATSADKAIGQLKGSLTTKNAPQGIDDDRLRVSVYPFGFRRILRMVAEGSLVAGDKVCQGTVSKQAVKKMSDLAAAVTPNASGLSGSIPSGETPVASDAAQPTVAISGSVTATAEMSGGVLPETEIGVVWKGAADGAEVLILVR